MRCVCLLTLALVCPLRGQDSTPADKPAPAASAPRDAKQDAKKLFAQATLQKNHDLYVDAIRSLEECLRLDGDASPPYKMLAGLYRVVGRMDDAVAAATRVTEKNPGDFDGWERLAELLGETGKAKEAVGALAKAVACANAAEDPEHWLNTLHRLAIWADKQQDFATLDSASRKSLEVLGKYRDTFRRNGFLGEADFVAEKSDAWERVGRACLKQRRFDDALAAYREAASPYSGAQDPIGKAREQRLHLHLAELHDARGEPNEALPHLIEYLKLRPHSIEPYRLFVSAAQKSMSPSEAIARLVSFARADMKNAALQMLLAEQYSENNSFGEALTIYEALLTEQPKVEFARGMVKLCVRFSRMDRVLARLDEQLKLAEDGSKSEEGRDQANHQARAIFTAIKDNPAAMRAILPLALEEMQNQARQKHNFNYKTFAKLGNLAAQSQDLESAENFLREAVARARFSGMRDTISEPLINVQLARRKYQEVITLCDAGLKTTDLNQFMYIVYKAFPEAVLFGLKPALETIDQAIAQAHSEDARIYARIIKIDILLWHGEISEATSEAQGLFKDFHQPKHVRRARFALAHCYVAARDFAKAEQQLRILLEYDANDAQANNELGFQLAVQSRNLEEAERLARRAIELDRAERQRGGGDEDEDEVSVGENAAFLDSLGWVLFRRGKLVEARDTLERAVALPDGKDEPAIWDHLGDVRFRLGDTAKAREAWARSVKLYEEDRRTRKDGRYDELRRKLMLNQ